jgi:hypothetical protein
MEESVEESMEEESVEEEGLGGYKEQMVKGKVSEELTSSLLTVDVTKIVESEKRQEELIKKLKTGDLDV